MKCERVNAPPSRWGQFFPFLAFLLSLVWDYPWECWLASIHFVCGKPGAGKSYLAMKVLSKELRESNRNIVTNLPINLDNLNRDHQGCRVMDRVYLLHDDDPVKAREMLAQFYRYRGRGHYTPEELMDGTYLYSMPKPIVLDAPDEKNGGLFDVGPACVPGSLGVLYILDEAQIVLNARAWAKTSKGILFYCSQHRKLGDDVYVVTQRHSMVDSQVRDLAETFSYARNNSKFNVMSYFRGVPWVTYWTYDAIQGDKVLAKDALLKGRFRINKDTVGSWYNTAKGVGVSGLFADTKQRAKGMPVYMLPVMLGVLGYGLLWGYGQIEKYFLRKSLGGAAAVVDKVLPATNTPAGTPEEPLWKAFKRPSPVTNSAPQIVEKRSAVRGSLASDAILITGYLADPLTRFLTIYFPDGGEETLSRWREESGYVVSGPRRFRLYEPPKNHNSGSFGVVTP